MLTRTISVYQGHNMSYNNYQRYKSLGQLIKDYRQWRKQSQEEFADSINVSVRQLRRWEAGLSHASVENLHDIANATGIPMETCITLNFNVPLWYSLQEKRVAHTFIEANLIRTNDLLKNRKYFDREIPVMNDQIITDKHIDMIISYHHDTYCIKKPLGKDVYTKAINILPDLNRITFDNWGLLVGYVVCLPMKLDEYLELKTCRFLEDYLTKEKIIDVLSLNEGVFLSYSIFASSLSVAYPMIINNLRYLSTIKNKKRFLVAFHTNNARGKEYFNDLGMKTAWKASNKDDANFNITQEILDIKLDILINQFKRDSYPPVVDNPPIVDNLNFVKKVKDNTNTISCPNPKCIIYGKNDKNNIIRNGTYQTNKGILRQRFNCKKCGVSFNDKTKAIFYRLRSPEEKIVRTLNLLVKGMSLTDTANFMKVKPDTIRHWLKVAAQHRGKIDDILIEKLKVFHSELDNFMG